MEPTILRIRAAARMARDALRAEPQKIPVVSLSGGSFGKRLFGSQIATQCGQYREVGQDDKK